MATVINRLSGSAAFAGSSIEHKRFTRQIIGITAFGVGLAYTAAWYFGRAAPKLFQVYAGVSLFALVIIGAGALLGYTASLFVKGERRPFGLVWAKAAQYLTPAALADRVLPILLVFSYFSAFSVFKSLIPTIHPFVWDATFSDLDRLLFGTDPWRLTHAVLGPSATKAIDLAYVTWFPGFACVVFWHSVFAPFEQKRRFFLTFFGCWGILGVIAATTFSSAGPCFLSLIHHPYAERYPFFPLQYGRSSQGVMDYLAQGYRKGDFGVAKGISAFPSMHISVVALYLVSARKPWTLLFASIYFLLIFVGSIHLGWHYASDGIFAAIGTFLIYSMTRPEEATLHAGGRFGSVHRQSKPS
jgi:hypothetical protein